MTIDYSDAHVEQRPVSIACAKFPGMVCHAVVPFVVKPDGMMYGYFTEGCNESYSCCPECEICLRWCTEYVMGLRQLPPVLYPPNTIPPA